MKKCIIHALILSGFLATNTLIHAQPASQPAYFQAITNLNPVGYWPMHEIETAAPGDTETNYGTLGLLGTGYYSDWEGGAANSRIHHGFPGAIASDSAVYFGPLKANVAAGTATTNGLYVPHTSPLATLVPPFSVECWFYATNSALGTNGQGDILGQDAFEGLNAGKNGNGDGNVCGFRLYWNRTQIIVETYANSSANNAVATATGVTTNQWYYIVVTCDANTNFSLWVNDDEDVNSAAGVGQFIPDYWGAFEVGNSRGDTHPVGGLISEVAAYNFVLTNNVTTHYNAASGGANAYFQAVTNDHPLIYLRMNSPTYAPTAGPFPVLTNYGSAGANGIYTAGTVPGIAPGPATPGGVPFTGLSGSTVAALSGVSSFADAGYASAFNPVGATPFSISALFRGNPCDGRLEDIVGHSDNSWRILMSTNGTLQCQLGTNTSSQVNSTGVYNDGNWHEVVEVYTPNSSPTLPGTNALYVDGVLDSMTNGVTASGILPGTNSDVIIGAAPDYTNNAPGLGRQFAGQVCEVALFTNALTTAQIGTLYSVSEQVPPYIKTQPASANVNGGTGSSVNFNVVAGGPSPAYQWYIDTSSNYAGATPLANNGTYANVTTSQLTITNLTGADNGYYFVIITNSYGSVTSVLASLTVNTAPAINAQYPVPYTNRFTLFAGVSPAFSIAASGAQPISYFWYTNGILDASATASGLTWSNVQIGSITNFCIASNSLGSATSMVWVASVVAGPTAPYPASVMTNNPVGYWRLNEPDDGNGANDGNDGAVCHDYVGGNDGLYTNMVLGQPGYSPTTDPTETSAYPGENDISFYDSLAGQIEGVDFAVTNGGNGEFTVEAWANAYSGGQVFGAPLAAKGLYGIDDEFNLGVDSTKVHYRFYVRDAGGTQHVVGSGSSLAFDSNWHHVVGVCDEANGLLSLYVDGKLANTAAIPANAGVSEAPEPMEIGAGSTDGINYTNQFYGYINDVSVYRYAMSAGQIVAQFVATDVSPSLSPAPPTAETVFTHATLTLPSGAVGTPPLGYQWYDVNAGTNVAAGSTNGDMLNTSLTVSNVPAAWNGDQLELIVTNAYGSTNVFVPLTVTTPTPPQIAANLPSPVIVVSGQSYTYSVGVFGVAPYYYQWYQAGAPVAGQTSPTFTVTAGSPGSTTYSVVVTNIYGAVTSTVSTFTSIASPGHPMNSFATNLLQLNPVGYWPMHEVEAPAAGDEEVNYGSLGQMGSGYYSDWEDGTNSRILRNFPGAIKGDSDTATYFAAARPNVASGAATTNALYVPHTSPLATLIPPFTVECWYEATNNLGTNGQGDILGQSAYEGLNAGDNGAGTGNVCGFRLYWDVTRIDVFGYADSSVNNTLGSAIGVTTNNWYYIVVTCDANTNFNLYTNGVLAGSQIAGAGLYIPDSWMPFEVGNSRGDTHPLNGVVDEVAVYTNVLADFTNHYAAGISGQAGLYKSTVLADNPLIYFWMDSPAYTAPAISNCPVLFNYGSAGANGLYTPGTVPGLVSGPATNSLGVPFGPLSGAMVPQLNGVSSFADAGYAAAYNPVGAVPFSISAMFRGNPCDGRVQDIVAHSASSWRVYMNAGGQLVSILGVSTSSQVTSTGVYNDGNWHQLVDVYSPASNPALNGTNALYVDGVLDSLTNGVTPGGIFPGTNLDVMIGTDPQFTNNPDGVGRQFAGQICEVALFTNALTAGQISALYTAIETNNVPAFFAPAPPFIASAAPGGTLAVTAGAAGSSPLSYQWQVITNGGTNILATGLTNGLPLNASLSIPNVPAAWNGGQLQLTVSNAYGSNSALVTLSIVSPVNPNPTNIVFSVTNNQLYLTWPADHTGWQLQAQTNSLAVGIGTNWINVAGSLGTNQMVIPINLTNGGVFYRLTY